MRDSDWSREILLRSDWLGPRVALITTDHDGFEFHLGLGFFSELPFDAKKVGILKKILCSFAELSGLTYQFESQLNYTDINFQHNLKYCHD